MFLGMIHCVSLNWEIQKDDITLFLEFHILEILVSLKRIISKSDGVEGRELGEVEEVETIYGTTCREVCC